MSNLERKKIHSASAQNELRSVASRAISVAYAAFRPIGLLDQHVPARLQREPGTGQMDGVLGSDVDDIACVPLIGRFNWRARTLGSGDAAVTLESYIDVYGDQLGRHMNSAFAHTSVARATAIRTSTDARFRPRSVSARSASGRLRASQQPTGVPIQNAVTQPGEILPSQIALIAADVSVVTPLITTPASGPPRRLRPSRNGLRESYATAKLICAPRCAAIPPSEFIRCRAGTTRCVAGCGTEMGSTLIRCQRWAIPAMTPAAGRTHDGTGVLHHADT